MEIRRYEDSDLELIKKWSTDEKTHLMWCAGRTDYPITKESFDALLYDISKRCGDVPYVALDDSGIPVGFYCYSYNGETHEGMLKFVIVDPARRGRGLGRKMIGAAVEKAFSSPEVQAVHLMVFTENPHARKCYESVGFKELHTTPNAFKCKFGSWGRCNMVIAREVAESGASEREQ